MQAIYTLETGVKLTAFLWSDFLKGDLWREDIEVQKIINNKLGKVIKKKVLKDDYDLYFLWDGKKIYLNDYDYMPICDLVEYIKEQRINREGGFNDKLLATFLKDTENVGILFDLPIYESLVPELGLAFTGDKTVKALCVPTEKRYDKGSWGYKLSLDIENEAYKYYISSRDLYFSDFASMVLSGEVDIVVKKDFIKEQEEIFSYEPTIFEKVKNFFLKKEKVEKIFY